MKQWYTVFMLYLLFFIVELVLLFVFSRTVTQSLYTILFRITKSQKAAAYAISFFFLPGVTIHELAHLLTAELLFVRTGKISLWPSLYGNELKMGSVEIVKTDIIRRFIIGVAPVIVGMVILLGIPFYILYSYGVENLSHLMLFGLFLVIFEVSNTMFSSRKDMEGALGLLIFTVLMVVVLYVVGILVPESIIGFFNSEKVMKFFEEIDFFLIVPLTVDLVVYLASKLMLRVV